jgi:hypothetical protein
MRWAVSEWGVLVGALALGWLAGARLANEDDWAAPLGVRENSVKEMRDAAGRDAAVVESEHFVVIHTASADSARELARRLEAVYRAHVQFVTELGLPAHPPHSKLEVYFFATHDEFKAHLKTLGEQQPDILGCYVPASNRSAFFDLETYPPLAAVRATVEQAEPDQREKLRARLERRREILVLSIIQHEAAHQIERNLGLFPAPERVPTWLSEGLATLFEVPCDAVGSRLPVNGYRLFEFRKLYGDGPSTLGDVRRRLTHEGAWCGGQCYPLAWAVMQYLRDQRPAEFARLLRKAAESDLPESRRARAALFDELFGPINEAWVARLHAATMQLPFDSSAFAE